MHSGTQRCGLGYMTFVAPMVRFRYLQYENLSPGMITGDVMSGHERTWTPYRVSVVERTVFVACMYTRL